MYVFNYDPQTLAFIGGTKGDFDQLEPGRLLCPAWATLTPIPRCDLATEWPFYVADSDSWELRPIETAQPAPEPEPEPGPAQVLPEERLLRERAEAHLLEAQRLLEELKKAAP